MGDKIYIDTELLRQISSQLSQVHHSLSGIQQKLSNSVSEVRGVVSDQVGLINVLSAVQKNTQKDSDYTERLAKAVNNAAARWEEVERRLANQQIQGSEAAPQGTGTGMPYKMISTMMGAEIGAVIGALKAGIGGMMRGTQAGAKIGAGIGAELDAGKRLEYEKKVLSWDDFAKGPLNYIGSIQKNGLWGAIVEFATGKNNYENSKVSYDLKLGEYSAKANILNTSIKTKAQLGLNDSEYKGESDWYKKSGEIGYTVGAAAEMNLGQVEVSYPDEDSERSEKHTFLGAAGAGDIEATLIKNGKFDPRLYGKAKAEAYVEKVEISRKYGSKDLNTYLGFEVNALGAEAEAKGGIYRDENNNIMLGGERGAQAYIIKGEGKAGVDLYGIKIGAGGEIMLGGNARLGAEVGTGSASGVVGYGPIKVKINVDWSDFLDKQSSVNTQ